jgi:microcin C transport system permease protein
MKKFWILSLFLFLLLSFTAELWVGSRPLLVRYENNFYSPVFSKMRTGQFFGEDYAYEADYRNLQEKWRAASADHWMIMPLIPLGPLTIDLSQSPPSAPDARHWLGTDSSGRDVLARFVYGFRTAILMSLAYLTLTVALALILALISALSPSWVDLVLQRLMEIWVMIPFLYVAIALVSLVALDKFLLILILSFFSWPTLSLYLRAQILQIKEQDYIHAARILGLPRRRIVLFHIMPQIWPFLLSFLPFFLAGSLVTLTSLDFLGFGLPPPEPSWGDLLQQALERPHAWWIAAPVLVGLFVVLTAVTVIGEAIRNKQNPRQTQNSR